MLTALEREFLGAGVKKREDAKRLKRRLMKIGAAITAVAVVAAGLAVFQTIGSSAEFVGAIVVCVETRP